MRVLVTGGAGYVGSVTVERLVQAGHEVTVLDTLVTGHREVVGARRDVRRRAASATGTCSRGPCGTRASRPCSTARARSLVGQSMADPALYYHENVVGGIALLDALRAAGVDRIVFSSTAAVYGEPERVPIAGVRPDPTRQPLRRVQARVRGRDALVRHLRPAFGGPALLQRGGRQRAAWRGPRPRDAPHPQPAPGRRAAARPVTLFGDDYPTPDGTPIRDYIHVLDLADAHLLALEWTARAPPARARSCNLGSGGGFSVREVLDAAGDGGRSAHPACVRVPAARATRRCSWRPPTGPARCSAGRPRAAPGRR